MKRYDCSDFYMIENADGDYVLWDDVEPLLIQSATEGDRHTHEYEQRQVDPETLRVSVRRPREEEPHDGNSV